ncbi:MAG: hypothetical protein Q7T54_06145 [Candidatus Levybacteria bacterium]|nr:hypothetical protein [Candidatus Levybacteria bacterium]
MDDTDMKDVAIVDGQLEEASVSTEAITAPQSQAELIVSLTNLINANLAEITNIERDLSSQKEMIDSVLDNDATYKEHAEKAKEAARVKSNTKKEIFKRPDVKHVVEKLTELKDNLSDTREELSNYIQEYATASGQNYFEAEDGSIQEIVYVAKLRKKAA